MPDVSTPSKDHEHMVELSALPRTLMGGTRAMRKAGESYLPKEPAETPEAYQIRLKRSTLFNAFAKTVSDMTGKVFDKPVLLRDNVPAEIQTYAEDIDLTGRHLNVFARDVFYDTLQTGVGYIFVDMPTAVKREDGAPATVADEAKLRPYLVYIPMERLVGWLSSTINGAETLTQIRISECVSVPDGEFAEKEVEQIRVIEIGKWRTFRKSETAVGDTVKVGEWVMYKEGTNTLDVIPLVPVYTNRTGFMVGEPPLEKLADLNVAHWQSQSDQKNILHVARVPILFWAGKTDDEKVVVGAQSLMFSQNPDAKLTYVEHTGKAIEAGDKDLENLENQMQAMGLQLLVSTPGQSATGEVRDDAKETAPLAMMARSLGDAIEHAFGLIAKWRGLGADKGGEVEVNTDFGVQAGAGADVQFLTQAVIAGKLDGQTYIEELKRRKVLSDSVDPETVLSRIADAVTLEAKTAMDLTEAQPNASVPAA